MGATQKPRTGTNLFDERVHHLAQPQSTKVSCDPGVCDKIQARDIQPLLLVVILRKGETGIATEPVCGSAA
jgi:hypothetical protein